jgi:hypothetical protein
MQWYPIFRVLTQTPVREIKEAAVLFKRSRELARFTTRDELSASGACFVDELTKGLKRVMRTNYRSKRVQI